MNITCKLCQQLKQPLRNFVKRNIYTTCLVNAYEGTGKTTVTFISKDIGKRLLVSNYDETGFSFNTGLKILGPIVLFSQYALSWNVESGKDINERTLSLFTVLEPKPDVVIIGLDDKYDFTYYKNLQALVKKLDITAEIVSVHYACTTFNFMNEEGRYVVAALIPPTVSSRFLFLPKTKSKQQITDSSNALDNEKLQNSNNVK